MSKVQFNLLPDSKLTLNRNLHTKRLVFSIATIVSLVSVALLVVLLLFVDGVQKKLMSDAAKNVDKSSQQLKNLNVERIITVQNQLQALPALHQNKHVTSRIFTYLPKITPSNVSINQLTLDLTKNTMIISGTTDSQKTINTFIDTLKYATFTAGPQSSPAPAFQQVVESGFSLNAGSVGYTINMQFDPKLFTNSAKDAQGKVITPTISVSNITASGALKDPSNTLFNSSQTSAGTK
jgi:Tfp pilus assembly protein PilN